MSEQAAASAPQVSAPAPAEVKPKGPIVGLVIAAAVAMAATVWSFHNVTSADTECGPDLRASSRIVALELAGTADRFEDLDLRCRQEAAGEEAASHPPVNQIEADHATLTKEWWLILAYSFTLVLWCLLGTVVPKRRVTQKLGFYLIAAAVIAAVADILENCLLWSAVEHPADVTDPEAGLIAGLAVTKFMMFGLAGSFGLASWLGAVALILRSVFSSSGGPAFEPETPTTTISKMPDILRDRRGQQLTRFQRPDTGGVPVDQPSGVCFSGGGIRSASFTVGCLRALQGSGRLRQVHYMSTVSGGGYAAMAWQVAQRWNEQHGMDNEQGPLAKDAPEYRYLADNSRFLWPPLTAGCRWRSTRLFVGTMASVLRGIGFNVLLLVGLLYAVARPLGWWSGTWAADGGRPEALWQILSGLGQGVLVCIVLWPALSLRFDRMAPKQFRRDPTGPADRWAVWGIAAITVIGAAFLIWVVLFTDSPVLVSGFALIVAAVALIAGLAWAKVTCENDPDGPLGVSGGVSLAAVWLAALGSTSTWPRIVAIVLIAISLVFASMRFRSLRAASSVGNDKTCSRAGWTVAFIVVLLGAACSTFWRGLGREHVAVSAILMLAGLGSAAVWILRTRAGSGSPGVLLALVAIGFAKIWLDGGYRHSVDGWHSIAVPEIDVIIRVGILLVVMVTSLALARLLFTRASRRSLVVVGMIPLLIAAVPAAYWLTGVALSSWNAVVGVVIIVLLLCSSLVGPFAHLGRHRRLPYNGPAGAGARFLAGLSFAALLTVGTGLHLWRHDALHVEVHVKEWLLWTIVTALLVLAYALLDQKWWSPHEMYKQRLGATFARVRSASDDPEKTAPLQERSRLPVWAEKTKAGPQLLISAAAYDTTSFLPSEIPTVPFVFAADYVGSADMGFARTVDFEAVLGRVNEADSTLRSAMAVSGAAVSQAIGAIRKASFSQVIALFNLRLGVWLPSPSYINSFRGDGSTGLGVRWLKLRRYSYLLKEFTSKYDPEDRFVYVTDGGQLENLGLYELLVRRCAVVYAFDASGDGPTKATSLVQAMRLANERLGIGFGAAESDGVCDPAKYESLVVSLDPSVLDPAVPDPAVLDPAVLDPAVLTSPPILQLTIFYPSVLGLPEASGRLHFAKARMWMGAPHEVTDYISRTGDAEFPNNSTIDQFLEPDQFAAYVCLGEAVATALLAASELPAASEPAPTAPG
ncbi:MAG: hypothetical protein Q7V88_06140 [Actinomycetota bacterium]|nr:hypothetical protein [Actinomycetota bacterium]